LTGCTKALAIACLGLAGLVGCGGGGSSGPTSPPVVPSPRPSGLPAGTVLTIVSGEDGQPVTTAKVTVGGQQYQADASGAVSLTASATWGTLVDVVSAGYLDRQTLVRRDGTRIALWPVLPHMGFDSDYIAQLVYTAGTANPPPQGSTPLRRIPPGTTAASVSVSSEIAADDGMMAMHESAVASMNSADGGRVIYSVVTTRPTSGEAFDVKIDSADPICTDNTLAYTQVSVSGNDIVGGRIVYCGPDVAKTSTVTHELGHTFGLQHSLAWTDLMAGIRQRGVAQDFGPREILAMALMLQRPSGNRFPDNDRDIPAARRGTVTFICR